MKTKTTKRALLMSGLSLLLCFSMLVGSTFAWFTDSVTSANNIIKSGTLDVEMYWADGTEAVPDADAGWTDASQGAIFDYALWEPGYTEVRHLKVANVGNLALKYQLHIVPTGEVSKLADVIDVYYADPAVQVADRADLDESMKLGTLAEVLKQLNTSASGNLVAGAADTVTIALKMQESAGNEYQNLSIGSEFAIQLVATQLTSEFDSFDNQYDKLATVDSMDELEEALAADYDVIQLGADFAVTETIEIPAGKEVIIDLKGFVMSQEKECTESYAMIKNSGKLTITDSVGTGKISMIDTGVNDGSAWGVYTINNVDGDLVVNGGTIENLCPNSIGNVNNAIFTYSGNVTINGGSFSVPYSRTVRQWKGTLTINDGSFDGQVWVQAQGDCTTTINGGYFQPGSKSNDGSSIYVTYGNKNVDLLVAGGTLATKLGSDKVVPGTVTGGRFGTDPVAYVADGFKTVQVGSAYEIVADNVNYATASNVDELQAALDNAANVNLIVLTDDIVGNVTAKQISGLKITINGDNHEFDGCFVIDGNSAAHETSSMVLKNIKFVGEGLDAALNLDACINLGRKGDAGSRYTSNVTIDSCTFDKNGTVGVSSYTGGDKNLTIKNCVVTANAHSLAQLKGVQGVLVEGCTVKSIRGINFNNSVDITVKNCTVDVQKYALRFGSDENTTVENYTITDCTLKSDNVDNDAVIVLRAGATNANLTLENVTIEGAIEMTGHENANIVVK